MEMGLGWSAMEYWIIDSPPPANSMEGIKGTGDSGSVILTGLQMVLLIQATSVSPDAI